ncbi:MAG: prepilin-type N-terminal cleavage/methylation domain-containing protein [Actinomycetota bacterium]|nr:MAG: prepilin-type N-terminal cleavage/methylation domain-containing protein [Actinomycetota bacterium]
MMRRLRNSMEKREEGFTLIELLVVIIIIGILAAIAIPVFLNQRKKGVDASIKSDLRTVANQEETYAVDKNATYLPVAAATGTITIGQAVTLSPGNSVTVTTNATHTAFCAVGSNTGATQAWVWVSDAGGLQASTSTACPSGYSTTS